ncbi:Sentrin-specific protease 1 [Colletotrichum orbiculare MAFF 240422]|uniref:Sentrin-specific protease 1 n=1 Tax=Colletotrichum orbiculare (strain 104-T / ATCC 96160 / CBS 514.97 / LARS 414 / MAFF 240422) TaxID=1213857 RepID=A0A484FNQ8_COLOR|nr:Sentrin-specific protease 1 [Colletotrichum orbiculare MAFF 240422]
MPSTRSSVSHSSPDAFLESITADRTRREIEILCKKWNVPHTEFLQFFGSGCLSSKFLSGLRDLRVRVEWSAAKLLLAQALNRRSATSLTKGDTKLRRHTLNLRSGGSTSPWQPVDVKEAIAAADAEHWARDDHVRTRSRMTSTTPMPSPPTIVPSTPETESAFEDGREPRDSSPQHFLIQNSVGEKQSPRAEPEAPRRKRGRPRGNGNRPVAPTHRDALAAIHSLQSKEVASPTHRLKRNAPSMEFQTPPPKRSAVVAPHTASAWMMGRHTTRLQRPKPVILPSPSPLRHSEGVASVDAPETENEPASAVASVDIAATYNGQVAAAAPVEVPDKNNGPSVTSASTAVADLGNDPAPVTRSAVSLRKAFCFWTASFARTLAPAEWLNDEAVFGILSILSACSVAAGHRKTEVIEPLLVTSLNPTAARSVTAMLTDEHPPERLLLPVHLQNHWILAVVCLSTRRVELFDSMPTRSNREEARDVFLRFASTYLGNTHTAEGWQIDVVTSAEQDNDYDCGVFVLVNAAYAVVKRPPPSSISSSLWRQAFAFLAEPDTVDEGAFAEFLQVPEFDDVPMTQANDGNDDIATFHVLREMSANSLSCTSCGDVWRTSRQRPISRQRGITRQQRRG